MHDLLDRYAGADSGGYFCRRPAATTDRFYTDPDLLLHEVVPGYISADAQRRARKLLSNKLQADGLGRAVTHSKAWLTPEQVDLKEDAFDNIAQLQCLELHGMARLAWDEQYVYLNGHSVLHSEKTASFVRKLCLERRWQARDLQSLAGTVGGGFLLRWLLANGAFALPENS